MHIVSHCFTFSKCGFRFTFWISESWTLMRCSCGPGHVPCTFSPSTFLDIHMSQVKSCEHSLLQRICLTSFQSLCKNRCDVVTHPDMPDRRSSLLFRAAACTYSQHEHNSIIAALSRPMPNTSPVASDDPPTVHDDLSRSNSGGPGAYTPVIISTEPLRSCQVHTTSGKWKKVIVDEWMAEDSVASSSKNSL
jgi:hypothetical protein